MNYEKFSTVLSQNPFEALCMGAGVLLCAAGKHLAKEGKPLHEFANSFNEEVLKLLKKI
jgi:hypothetical protein